MISLLCILSAGCGNANEPRTGIAGSVCDWGAFGGTVPVDDNQVVCRNAETGEQVLVARTDADGHFFLPVPPGRYEVAYSSGSKPAWADATVVADEVTTLEPFVGTRGGGVLSLGVQRRLKERVQPFALALGVAQRKTTMLEVTGTTVGAAAAVFGVPSGLTADTQVWVCIVSGDVEAWSSATASRNLARGGYVAYELHAQTLELLSTQSASRAWRLPDSTEVEDWGPTNGSSLF